MVTTNEPTANGVTYGVHGQGRDKQCYAEFGMTASVPSRQWQSCILEGRILYIYLYFITGLIQTCTSIYNTNNE